ncbi:MAG TPA: Fe-S protein assembly co-chaperone HscB [Candidatus Cybelea sp.]|nr:Fe-S protein assembly co-chaperone HscB [Candidatus Cybelea sp.]
MAEVAQHDGRVREVHPCWSCNGPVSARAPFCHTCGAIQPPHALDHFARLNLVQSFDVSPADLERQYFGLQRYFHPDRFASKTAKERALSLQHATSLNEAYETLKNPLRRAEYLLTLKGKKPHGADGTTIDDPALLMEAMELREALADAADVAAVDRLTARATGERDAALSEIGTAFAAGDLDRAAGATARLAYMAKLLDEARSRRARLGA